MDGPEIESRWGGDESFCTYPDQPWAQPASCTMGTGSFPRVKSGPGLTLTPHPLLMPWSRKSRYIPLHPLWAVRPVQSLSTCTRVHFDYFFKYNITKFKFMSTEWIYVFGTHLRTNSDHFPLQHKLTGSCNRHGVCLLRGTK